MALLDWATLPRSQIARALANGAPAALPVGSLEQHGEHLPTDTDAYLVTHVTARAAARSTSDVLVLPTVPYGISGYHERFGGTVSLSDSTYAAVLRDICASVRAAGASALVIVNGHGGNQGALQSLGSGQSDSDFSVVPVAYWELAAAAAADLFHVDAGSIGHAGQLETSLMLHTRPELVGAEDGHHEPILRPIGSTIVQRLGATGVIGNAAAASADLGGEFIDTVTAALADLLDSLAGPSRRAG